MLCGDLIGYGGKVTAMQAKQVLAGLAWMQAKAASLPAGEF